MNIREWVAMNRPKYKDNGQLVNAFLSEMWAHLTPYDTKMQRRQAAMRMIKLAERRLDLCSEMCSGEE